MPEDLGSAILDLAVDNSKLKAGMAAAARDTDASVESMGAKMKSAGLKLTQTLTPIAAALAVAFGKAFQEFDAGADALRVGTGKVGAELDGLVESMKRVGGQVTQPLSEVGKVMAELATRTKLTGKPLEDLTKQVLDLARITGGDAQASVAGITRLFGDWSIATEDMTPTLDKLFRTSQATGIGVQALSELMVQFGSPLRNLGLDFDTSAAMFAKFEQEGVNIQTVMPGLKMALKNFAAAGREPADALKETFKSMQDAKSESELMGIAFETFGARAGPDLAAAVREGRFEFDDLINKMENGSDTIAKATADTTDLSDKMAMWRNRIIGVMGPFGELGSVVMGAVASIGPALFGLGTIMDSSFGTMIAGWVKSAGAAVASAATQVAQWVMLGVQSLLNAAKVAAAWLIAMGPIAIVGAAVIALVALIVTHWEEVKDFLAAAWEWIKDVATKVWDAIKAYFTFWINTVRQLFTTAWEAIKTVLSTIWNGIKFVAETVWNALKAYFTMWLEAIKFVFTTTWDVIKTVVTTVWHAIKQTVETITDTIKNIVVGAWQAIGNVVSGVVDGIRGAVSGAFDTIKSIISTAMEAVKALFRGDWGKLKDIVVDAAGNLLDFIRSIPEKILNALGNMGRLLYNAGRAVITGLLDGIKAALGAVWDTVSGIAGKIAGLKGPLTYDLKLLVPQGRALMTGLTAGIQLGFEGEVAPLMKAITATIGGEGASSRSVNLGGINQTIHGVMPGDVRRETERAIRRTVVAWDMP